MQVSILKPKKEFQKHIQKITVFRTFKKITYQQKLTPSPFTCLSYNHFDIPDFKVNGTINLAESKMQVTGPKINDDIYALHHGKLLQVLIELKPSSFFYLFGQSPIDIVNQTVGLKNFIQPTFVDDLLELLQENNHYRSHVKKLYDFLEKFIGNATKPVIYIDEATDLIDRTSGNITVHSVCDKINKSERQFNRKFREIMGIPPIQYIKIRQLHFIINLIHLKEYRYIKEIAYDTGFYDPAHFTKSFKKLTGMSPEVFIKSDAHIALDYFSELI